MNQLEPINYEIAADSIKWLAKALSNHKIENLFHSPNQSDDIKELVGALSKAQGKMEAAKFNRVNPHFKNRYADFTAVMDACRHPLADNGLSVMQYCETMNEKLTLVTLLAHTSGQWIKSYFPLNPASLTSQAIGSAMTYAKRYSLSAMLGIVSDEEDDDGEASHGRGTNSKAPEPAKVNTNSSAKASQKILPTQVAAIKELDAKLDQECKNKIYSWLQSSYKVEKIEDILVENFQKVMGAFENAVKFLEQQKVEVVSA